MVVIRAPHGQRSRGVKVVKSRKGKLEIFLLTLAWLGFFVPLLWIATRLLAFADFPLRPVPFIAGLLFLAVGLCLFHRPHPDLGTNVWIPLDVGGGHRVRAT